MTRIELVSVNVSLPEVIGTQRGRPVRSGIKKRPVSTGTVAVGETNIGGDGQADLRVHGGPDKAVYAYPSEHLPWWNAQVEREPPFGPGTFGENLTTAGVDEHAARIGDVWRWGTALLQICQPRSPCYKLAMATGRPDMLKRFLASGRSGWYLRVLQVGEAPVAGPIEVVERDPAGVTISEANRAFFPGDDPEVQERVLGVSALAASWRGMVG